MSIMRAVKNKFVCVHGHFYQPPRENPWTGEVDPEDSAVPYRDWNERIAEECYGPNARCPIPDDEGRIVDMADNYRRMSFNFGPTLLSWLERRRPALYAEIIQADAESVKERGFGNAIAQPYIHAILPLQTLRDKRTLVRWGIDDFTQRFRRRPEGMWLPETGVDDETLEVLLDEGIGFTILDPRQAARVRTIGEDAWKDAAEKTLIPTRPYRWRSRERPGKELAIFFLHRGLHESVIDGTAFDKPDNLLKKIAARFHPDDSTQLVNVATDGEFFGHHHRAGAAVLGRTLVGAEQAGLTVTNYAAYLSRFPPPQEVEISPRTAWSCEHGLGRWTEDCGCRSSHLPKWRQEWRGPLRAAFDSLAAEIDSVYEKRAGDYFIDYWRARDRYARRLFSQEPSRFLAAEARKPLSASEKADALALLELQRHRLAMFTSCGWFFDDVSGIEAVQCLKFAGRAVELAKRFGEDLEPSFLENLAQAPSNVKKLKDGAAAYRKLAAPNAADGRRAAAHFALLDHIGAPPAATPRFSAKLSAQGKASKPGRAERDRFFSWQRISVKDSDTQEIFEATAVVWRLDRLDFSCRVGAPDVDAAALEKAFHEVSDDDFTRALDDAFGASSFGLDALFAEERRQALRLLTPSPLLPRERRDFLRRWGEAIFAMGHDFSGDDKLLALLEVAKELKLQPDQLPWIERAREALYERLETMIAGAPLGFMARALVWAEVFERERIGVSLWRLQDFFWRWRAALAARDALPGEREAAAALGEKLNFSERTTWSPSA